MERDLEIAALRRFVGEETFDYLYAAVMGLSPEAEDPLFGLTDLERLVMRVFTESMIWYSVINNELRRGKPSPDIEVISQIVDRALAKLPAYRGLVYRGVDLPVEKVRQAYAPGERVQWVAFSSVTPDRVSAFDGNVTFVISSLGARLLEGYSANPAIREVLFPRKSWYYVKDQYEAHDRIFVELGEIQW